MSVQIILKAHKHASFTLSKEFIRRVFPKSLLGQALETDPEAETIPIPNAVVTPKAIQVLYNLSYGLEPNDPDKELEAAAVYLNCERLLVYASDLYSTAVMWRNAYAYKEAIEAKSAPVVRYLVHKGIKPSMENLLAAIQLNCPEIVRLLYNFPQMDWTFKDNELLNWACRHGHLDIVQTLLSDSKRGVDPAIQGNGALLLAVEGGHLDVVQHLLMDTRVDPGDSHNYVICGAAEKGHLEVVRVLMHHPKVDPSDNKNAALLEALKNGWSEIVELLLTDSRVKAVAAEMETAALHEVQTLLSQEEKSHRVIMGVDKVLTELEAKHLQWILIGVGLNDAETQRLKAGLVNAKMVVMMQSTVYGPLVGICLANLPKEANDYYPNDVYYPDYDDDDYYYDLVD